VATNTEEQDRTIGQLVADATRDITAIVHNEIALAKAEVSEGAKKIGAGIGMFAGAAFVALLGLIFLFHTAAWAIAEWLPVWAGYLIVAVLLFIIAGVLVLIGRNSVTKAQPKPERAIKNAQETVNAVTGREAAPTAPARSTSATAASTTTGTTASTTATRATATDSGTASSGA
jgi:hypothetical protein